MNSNDYRTSHIDKGLEYDNSIASSALDAYMDKWEGHYLDRALTQLFPNCISRYLDFACGTGRITRRVETRAIESVAVDVSESMLSKARAKCRTTTFVLADITRDNVNLGLFDLATSFRFFGNAQDTLRSEAMAAINRHLHPGGYLIVNNHRNPRSFLGVRRVPGKDTMTLTHGKLKALLAQHGFRLLHRHAIGFWIIKFGLTTEAVLQSEWAAKMERAFRHSWLAPFSPDSLVVAQKTHSGIRD